MPPFLSDDVPFGDDSGWEVEVVLELPAGLAEADAAERERYERGEWAPATAPPCVCRHCASPSTEPGQGLEAYSSAAEEFGAHHRAAQQSIALAWKAAAALHSQVLSERGPHAAEYVGSHLALLMGVHTRTGTAMCVTAVRAARDLPHLAELVQSGKLTDKHVAALLDEVGRWTESDEQALVVLEQTVSRCRERADRYGWPTPGELKKQLKAVALLHDMQAAEKKRQSVAERRGVSLWQTGPGGAALTIEGPDAQLLLAYRAIQERAEAMRHLEGDTRTRAQREADAAVELLTVDAEIPAGGAVSARPTTGLDGQPLDLVVRGAHIAIVAPYSVLQGGDLELAEVPGLGYLLPSTTRELAEHADRFHRVAVNSVTGEVVAVDDAVPGPHRRRVTDDDNRDAGDKPDDPDDDPGGGWNGGASDDDPSSGPPAAPAACLPPEAASAATLSPNTRSLLRELVTRKVIRRDLNTSAYRVPGRLRRMIEQRDRTCTFPGCNVPGSYCDIDHREEWPRGGTHAENCHALCRRHHRAKQFYFVAVTLDPDTGDTCWTTYEGITYRRPPPGY